MFGCRGRRLIHFAESDDDEPADSTEVITGPPGVVPATKKAGGRRRTDLGWRRRTGRRAAGPIGAGVQRRPAAATVGRRGVAGKVVNLHAAAPTTASAQVALSARTHNKEVSVPMPRPWVKATGQQA